MAAPPWWLPAQARTPRRADLPASAWSHRHASRPWPPSGVAMSVGPRHHTDPPAP
jgi:hypothetical protein